MGFLKGKTAIITGAGRAVLSDGKCGSIGYGIATAYAKEGANLVITGRNEQKLLDAKAELEKNYKVKVLTLVADINAGADNEAVANMVVAETMKKFGYVEYDELGNCYYTEKASQLGKKIFDTMRSTADKFIEEYNCDYKINTEQIPAESASAKLMKKDKIFYPDANIFDLPLYGNQFMPLGIQSTGQERVRVQALFDGYCNGGSILHYNIDAPFDSFEKAWHMVNYIAEQGVTYFAFNTKISACETNHAFYGDICPVCGKPKSAEFTRIVGFFTKTATWSKERKEEFKMRKWDNSIND